MTSKQTILDIAYAALLHDVGKFYQRTMVKANLSEEELVNGAKFNKNYYSHLHAGFTHRFFKENLKKQDNVEKISSSHHQQNTDFESRVVQEADQIASKIDRGDEEEDNGNRKDYITKRLTSIFSEIDFGTERKDFKLKLSKLSEYNLRSINENVIERNVDESAIEYAKLFEEFATNLKVTNEVTYQNFNTLYAQLKEYTSLIPASTYKEPKCSVSLFDHLKLTSAIASALAYENSLADPKFILFEYDVSGIQKFIYKITEVGESKRRVSKGLRGRSFFVYLLSEFIAYTVLNEFNLTVSSNLYSTGGGGVLLLPVSNDAVEKLENCVLRLQKQLFEMFSNDLTFVSTYKVITKNELVDYNNSTSFDLKEKVTIKKRQKPLFTSNEIVFSKDKICKLCNSNITSNEICDMCEKINDLAEIVVNTDKFALIYDFDNSCKRFDFDFKFGSIGSIKISRDLDSNYRYVQTINDPKIGNFKYYANAVPKTGNSILSFSEIVDKFSDGSNKLAILKMDVDNLGCVFGFGIVNSNQDSTHSISKVITLSRQIDYFFSKLLKEICNECSIDMKFDRNSFYINYAGGDDLVIIGAANAIIELAAYIRNYFKDYTRNDALTLSGGIVLQNPKKPIKDGIQSAEAMLEKSKNRDDIHKKKVKNAITIFDRTYSYEDYNNALKQGKYFSELIRNEKIGRTYIYNFMTLSKDINIYTEKIPILNYSLYNKQRGNIEDDLRMELRKRLLLNGKLDIDLVKTLNLSLKLAILLTREEQ